MELNVISLKFTFFSARITVGSDGELKLAQIAIPKPRSLLPEPSDWEMRPTPDRDQSKFQLSLFLKMCGSIIYGYGLVNRIWSW